MLSNHDISEANRLAKDLSGLNLEPEDAAMYVYILQNASFFFFFFLWTVKCFSFIMYHSF